MLKIAAGIFVETAIEKSALNLATLRAMSPEALGRLGNVHGPSVYQRLAQPAMKTSSGGVTYPNSAVRATVSGLRSDMRAAGDSDRLAWRQRARDRGFTQPLAGQGPAAL